MAAHEGREEAGKGGHHLEHRILTAPLIGSQVSVCDGCVCDVCVCV